MHPLNTYHLFGRWQCLLLSLPDTVLSVILNFLWSILAKTAMDVMVLQVHVNDAVRNHRKRIKRIIQKSTKPHAEKRTINARIKNAYRRKSVIGNILKNEEMPRNAEEPKILHYIMRTRGSIDGIMSNACENLTENPVQKIQKNGGNKRKYHIIELLKKDETMTKRDGHLREKRGESENKYVEKNMVKQYESDKEKPEKITLSIFGKCKKHGPQHIPIKFVLVVKKDVLKNMGMKQHLLREKNGNLLKQPMIIGVSIVEKSQNN